MNSSSIGHEFDLKGCVFSISLQIPTQNRYLPSDILRHEGISGHLRKATTFTSKEAPLCTSCRKKGKEDSTLDTIILLILC